MIWPCHAAIGFSLAQGMQLNLPMCILGSLFPDFVEIMSRRVLVHRGISHSIVLWTVGLLASWNTPFMPFFLSACCAHLLPDSLNAMGVPVWDGVAGRRLTLFFGRLRNRTLAEILVTGILAFVFFAIIPSVTNPGLSEIEALYNSGLIDRYEYEQRKDKLSSLLDQFLGRGESNDKLKAPQGNFTAPDIRLEGFLDKTSDHSDP